MQYLAVRQTDQSDAVFSFITKLENFQRTRGSYNFIELLFEGLILNLMKEWEELNELT